jgi:transcriptional regulator with XRE-family HTH domain
MRSRTVLARNLRRLRHQRRLSQEALADEAGMSRSYLSDLETEKCAATLDRLDRLAEALGVQPPELIDKDSDRPASTRHGPR